MTGGGGPGPRRLPPEIRKIRRKIDELDRQLIRLLNDRSQWAVEIGHRKREAGLPVHDPEREREILGRAVREGKGPLADEAMVRLFERILDESRRLERLASGRGAAGPRGEGD